MPEAFQPASSPWRNTHNSLWCTFPERLQFILTFPDLSTILLPLIFSSALPCFLSYSCFFSIFSKKADGQQRLFRARIQRVERRSGAATMAQVWAQCLQMMRCLQPQRESMGWLMHMQLLVHVHSSQVCASTYAKEDLSSSNPIFYVPCLTSAK